MKTETVQPGSADAIVIMHIAMFGNTTRIMSGEPFVDTEKLRDQLERIEKMLYWNKNEIDTLNGQLRDRSSYYNLFDKQQKGFDLLKILHHQRQRIVTLWNRQLERMKI